MMAEPPSFVDDSGFAGSSPHPSAGRDSDVDTSPSTSLPGRRQLPVAPTNEEDEPHSAVERAMDRLQVKIAAFSLERRLVAAAAREQWKNKGETLNACGDLACRRAAGLLADRVRGLDERLDVCRSELNALGAARNLLITRKKLDDEEDNTLGLLGAEPDSLTMTSGDVASRACVQGATPARNSNNVLDAAVLLHLERRAHRETKRQLRELRKRHEVLKDELERLRESRGNAKIITEVENIPPPKDAAREICRLQAALLQLERVRDELTLQNKNLKTKVAELAARKLETPIIPHHPTSPTTNADDSNSESNRLRRKSTYKVTHGIRTGLSALEQEQQQPVLQMKNNIDHDLALAQCRLAAAERALQAREAETRAELARLVTENARLQEDCNRERVARKRCYSQLQSLRGKVRVFCRVRPPVGHLPEDESILAASDPYTLSVFAKPGSPSSLRAVPAPNPSPRDYSFDRVFGPTATQDDIFQETSDLLSSVMDGYNVCICAYGQTGTGKTHTILGSPEMPGLAPRVFTRLFELTYEAEARCDVNVSAYVLELYNDRLVDLLRPPDPSNNRGEQVERLEIRRDREGVVWVQGASVTPVGNADQLHQLFQRALSARRTASTRMNAVSSRSHLLIGVRVETSNRLTGSVLRGKVSLLDLAGSERVSRSGAVDEQLREASSINKSLAALGDVISALATDQPFVPYRNSKLTMLLQDSLGGNAKSLMFVTVSPDACDLDETITSLTYATRVRQITNTAKRMAESREIARLKQIIERMKRGERVDPESPETSRSDDRSTSS